MTKILEKAEPRQVIKHCAELGLDERLLASSLAVNPKTLQRWAQGTAQPNEAAVRALEKIEAICRLAERLLSKESRRAWFLAANETLGGERPADVLSRGELDQVKNVLGMLEWGIFS